MDVPVAAKSRRAAISHIRRRYPVDPTQAGGMQARAVSRSAPHLRNDGVREWYGRKNAVGNHRSRIGGTNAQMPVVVQTPEATAKPPVNTPCAPTEPHPEPTPRKIRKSGTGCLYQINDNLWEGSFFPRLPGGKRKKFNVYAETREQCEIKLAEMIERIKAEIAEEKAKLKEGDS